MVVHYAIYRYRLFLAAAIIGGGAPLAIAQGKSSASVSQAALGAEAPFLTENDNAMQTMIANMTVKPTGDVDRDFVAMMTPHHQGAIDMAQAELQYGHNPLLARVAQGIVVEQLQEIAAMRLAIGESASPTWVTDSPVAALKAQPVSDDGVKVESPYLAQNNVAMTTMMTNMTVKPTGDIDHDFVAMMVPHHQGAIDMARAELRYGHNPQLMRVAQEIVVDQIQEISMMRAVSSGNGRQNLVPLGLAGQAAHLSMAASANDRGKAPTSVTLFDQGLVQVLEAAVTGLAPKQPYVLALATQPDGGGTLQPLTAFMTNPAGAAIVDAVGPIRQIVQSDVPAAKQYLVILPGTADKPGAPAQVQVD